MGRQKKRNKEPRKQTKQKAQTSAGKNVKKYKIVQLFWKTVWQFLEKLNINSTYDPEIPLIPKRNETCIDTNT